MNEPLTARIEKYLENNPDYPTWQSMSLLREALQALRAQRPDLKPTIAILKGIMNSCVHPDVALRALLVDLGPIRKEIERLTAIERDLER